MADNFSAAILAGKSPPITALASRLGISRSTLYGAIKRGEIRAQRIGRRVIIPAQEAARLLGIEAAA